MLVSKKELTNLKLKSIKLNDLKELSVLLGISPKGSATDLVKNMIDVSEDKIDEFIKEKYRKQINDRQRIITDENLKKELSKVK